MMLDLKCVCNSEILYSGTAHWEVETWSHHDAIRIMQGTGILWPADIAYIIDIHCVSYDSLLHLLANSFQEH